MAENEAQARQSDNLPPEEVRRMEEALTRHYGEPVRPVSRYCDAFRDWHRALVAKLADPESSDYDRERYQPIVEALDTLGIPIAKSNLLHRLIYVGEALRTQKCPTHKGHWSGCVGPGEECPHCMSGNNVTGWCVPPGAPPQVLRWTCMFCGKPAPEGHTCNAMPEDVRQRIEERESNRA